MKIFKKKSTRKNVDWTASILMIAGSINWGLIGIPQLLGFNQINIVETLLSGIPFAVLVTYSLVGLSGLYVLLRNSKFMK